MLLDLQLERWGEAVRDYEILRKELPGDNEVAESLSRAQDALRLTRGEPSGIDRIRASTHSCGNFHNFFLHRSYVIRFRKFIILLIITYSPIVNYYHQLRGFQVFLEQSKIFQNYVPRQNIRKSMFYELGIIIFPLDCDDRCLSSHTNTNAPDPINTRIGDNVFCRLFQDNCHCIKLNIINANGKFFLILY